MKAITAFRLILLAGLLLGACSPLVRPAVSPEATLPATFVPQPGNENAAPPQPTAVPVQASAVPPQSELPPKPQPIYPRPQYPTCQADPIPPLDLSAGKPVEGAAAGSETALRPLANRRGLYFGTSTGPGILQQADFARLMVKHFNMIAIENAMKWEVVHPEPERYDFSQADALVAFAEANDMAVYGHVLVWDLQQPEWLTRSEVDPAGGYTRDEYIQILCRHIKTVVGRYRGHIYAWDVVNETFNNDGSLRDTLWMRVIGPEHIGMAFQWAREADPEALLILNEFYAEGLNQKSQAVYSLAQGLLEFGIPIDGVGMQMHIWLGGPPTQPELQANMQRLADLGLVAHITEMDVRTQYSQDPPEVEFERQAQHYRQALDTCLAAVNCNVFVTWGLTDRHSWIPDYTGVPDAPLLFDEQGRPKPAFDAVLDLLR